MRFRRLAFLQVAAVVTVLVLAGLGGAVASYNGSHAGSVRGAELQASQLLSAMQEQNQEITGYAVTAQPSSAARYTRARAATSSALAALRGGTANATRGDLVAPVVSAVGTWEGWAESALQLVRLSGPVAPQSDTLSLGESLFSAFQAALGALTSRLDSDARSALDLATFTGIVVELMATVGDAMVVLVMFLLLRRMDRLGLAPLGELAEAAESIAADGLAQIPHAERKDEIGALSRALRNWEDASREREVLVTQAPVGICRLDVQGGLQTANRRLGEILGQAPEALRHRPFRELFDSDELATQLRRWADGGDRHDDRLDVVARAVRTDDRMVWCSVTVGPMRGPDGGLEGSEAIIEDVTERRRQTERATRIQRDLWPRHRPALDEYDVAGICRPALDVAGDLYDWIEWPGGHLDLTVADVMGKGIGAALVMASLRAALRSAAESLGPAARLELAAKSITLGADEEGLFVTVFHCRLEPRSGELTYVDAGHGYCAVRRSDGTLVPLAQASLPVGVLAGERFREGRITLDPGDMLVVYSDGLVERPEGTVGLEAFADELGSAGGADDAVRRLLGRTSTRPPDDVTVLVLRRLREAPVATPAALPAGDLAAKDHGAAAGAGTPVVRLTGRLDAYSAPTLRRQMHELVESGATNLVLDLSGLVSIDTSGLGTMISGLKLMREAGGDLRVARPNQEVEAVLKLTTLDHILRPFRTLDEAVAGRTPEVVSATLQTDDARSQLSAVHEALSRFFSQLADGPSDEWRMMFELAVAEIAANIIEHAKATKIHFQLGVVGWMVTAEFTDTGQGWKRPPGPAAMVDELLERGRGLSLARTAVDELAYERRDRTNYWRLAKRLSS